MKKILQGITLLLAVLSIGVSPATEISNAMLQRLLVQSGTRQAVQQVADQVRISMRKAAKRAEKQTQTPRHETTALPNNYRQLNRTISRAFNATDLLGAVAEQIRRYVSEQDARAMLV